LQIFLPIADISVNIFYLIAIGGGVGVLSGMLGVGGGFLLTPILMMIGIPPMVAVATDANQIVASAASGTVFHLRAGNVNIRLGMLLLSGGLIGSTFGIKIVKYLDNIGNFEIVVKGMYIILLGFIGILMLLESLRTANTTEMGTHDFEIESKSLMTRIVESLPFRMNFPLLRIRASVIIPLIAGVFVGGLTAIMGVGGGFIMMPILVYLLGVPTLVAVGTSLFQVMVISVYVTIQQAVTNNAVDIILALILISGSVIGVQIGGLLSQRLKSHYIRIILAVLLIAVSGKMIYDVVILRGFEVETKELAPTELVEYADGAIAIVNSGINVAVLKYSVESSLLYGFFCVLTALIIGIGISVLFNSIKYRKIQ